LTGWCKKLEYRVSEPKKIIKVSLQNERDENMYRVVNMKQNIDS